METSNVQDAVMCPEDILSFWFKELSPQEWYVSTKSVDKKISNRFRAGWEMAQSGGMAHWLTDAEGALAFIILTDQMSRNMFREDGRAFATDQIALSAAKLALDRGWDRRIEGAARQFFYLPLMHSECVTHQEQCVRLMHLRMNGDQNLLHAKAHREVIRQFGRFPYRNAALGRKSTPAEREFLSSGGYGSIISMLQECVA